MAAGGLCAEHDLEGVHSPSPLSALAPQEDLKTLPAGQQIPVFALKASACASILPWPCPGPVLASGQPNSVHLDSCRIVHRSAPCIPALALPWHLQLSNRA